MKIKSILLIEASDMSFHEHGDLLLRALLAYNQFKNEKKNELIIPTNIKFNGNDPYLQMFSVYLRKLAQEGTFQIRINL